MKGDKIMKTIYLACEFDGHDEFTFACFDKAAAFRHARFDYEALKPNQKKTHSVYVQTWNLDIDGEGMTAEEVWQTACDEGMTDRDPDGYEVVDNETIALAKLSETPFTQVSKVFTVNGHEVEVTSCLYLYKADPVQEGVLVHDMTDEYHDGDAIYGDGNVIENIKEASDLEDILNYGAPETRFEKLADGLYKIL